MTTTEATVAQAILAARDLADDRWVELAADIQDSETMADVSAMEHCIKREARYGGISDSDHCDLMELCAQRRATIRKRKPSAAARSLASIREGGLTGYMPAQRAHCAIVSGFTVTHDDAEDRLEWPDGSALIVRSEDGLDSWRLEGDDGPPADRWSGTD